MAKSSKPKEIVVVGSKVKEVVREMTPPGLQIDVDDDLLLTLSWDIDLVPSSASPPPGFALSFFDDFEPPSTVEFVATTLTEDPLGILVGINDNLSGIGDEVLVSFVAGDVTGNYQVDLYLTDPSGTAIDATQLTTPLNLRLADFPIATLSFSELGEPSPFATADVLSMQSFVIPEPATIVLVASMLGTFAIRWMFGRAIV